MARAIWLPGGRGADLDVVTAAAGDVVKGKVIVDAEGNPLTGTLELTGNAAAGDIIQGKTAYTTNPKSKVTGTLVLTGSIAAADIRKGKTGYSTDPKTKITGTMAELAAQTIKPGTTAKTLSCTNKYMTGNITVPAISIPASYIKKGQKITFPDGSSITGEFEGWVPVATDLYYMGENPAGFVADNYTTRLEADRITILTSDYNFRTLNFSQTKDVTPYSKLVIEGVLISTNSRNEVGLELAYADDDDYNYPKVEYTSDGSNKIY